MIRLQAFGSAVLIGADGLPASRAASQRRTVGLLSLLAAAGEAGLSRDKLVGILWPDVSEKRARHSLTQAMYAARKALDCDDLFIVSDDIRLNANRITSDIAKFQYALNCGDDSATAELYTAPFLDGFFLDSPEFERWLSATRDRLEQQAIAALERLVAAAEEAGDLRGSIGWLTRLASIRPSDSSVTIRLMQRVAASGDRARAIEYAELHARILRDEYEIEPEPQIVALAESLRTPDALASEIEIQPVQLPRAPQAEITHTGGTRVSEIRYDGPPAERALPLRSPHHAKIRMAGVAVLVLLVLVAAKLLRRDPLPVLDQRVVVAPFRVHDADASLSYLREGLVDLLSTRLADDETARGVDAGAVLRAWRRAGITRESSASQDTMRKLAASFGAERLIVGSVVGGAERAVLSASVLHVPSGEVRGEAVVEGPIDSLVALTDQLAGKLLLAQAEPDGRLAGQTTHSLPALRSYLAGLKAYAQGDHAVAAEHYSRALRTDSSFALAALRLAFSAERLYDFELQRRALATAWLHQGNLSDRDRAHLLALTGPAYPAAAKRTENMRAWEHAAQLGANSAEVWYGFARAIIESGAATERTAERERASAALERTLELDPQHGAARVLLARLHGDSAEVRLFTAEPATADSLQSLAPFLRWRGAATRDDSLSSVIRDSFPHFGPANLRAITAASQFEAIRLEDGVRAVEILLDRAGSYDQAFDLLLAQHSMALNRGRPSEALQASTRLQRLSPATRAHLRLRVLDAVFADGDTTAAEAAARELESSLQLSTPPASVVSDACALAHWQLARNDTAAARASLDIIQNARAQRAPVSVHPAVCAQLIAAELAVAKNASGARAAVAALDSLVLNTAAVGDAAAFAHIALARMHRNQDDPARALAAIRRRPYMSSTWPRYRATALREEAELAITLQDSGSARLALQRWLDLRTNPEPSRLAEVDSIRALLANLQK